VSGAWTSDDCLGPVDTERAILGASLNWPDTLRAFLERGVRSDFFYRSDHALIWARLSELDQAGAGSDPVVLRHTLQKTGEFERAGGDGYLNTLTSGIVKPSQESVITLARELSTYSAARRTRAVFERAKQTVERDPAALRNGFWSHHLSECDALHALVQDEHAAIALPDVQFVEFAEYLDREDADTIRLGFPTLDDLTGGLRSENVGIILARPGIGKTLLAANVAHAVSVAPRPVGHVFFSLEMPRRQMVERLLRITFGLGHHELRQQLAAGEVKADQYAKAVRNLAIVERAGLSVQDMGRLVREAAAGPLRDVGVGLVTVDHLGLIGGDEGQSTYDRVSTQARQLKDFAKHHQVAVLLLAQVNRGEGGDGAKELSLASARDSGVVEEVGDFILALRRRERTNDPKLQHERDEYRDQIQARLLKNRHGDCGRNEVTLKLDPRTLRVTEGV
jgi:replicative DNA helicase